MEGGAPGAPDILGGWSHNVHLANKPCGVKNEEST